MILSLLTTVFLLASTPSDLPVLHHPDGRPALPDTAGFRSGLEDFDQLPPETRAERARTAQEVVDKWVPLHKARDGEMKVPLLNALYTRSWELARRRDRHLPLADLRAVTEMIGDLERAAAADPGNVTAQVLLGTVYGRTGRPRDAIDAMARARIAADRLQAARNGTVDPDEAAMEAEALRLATLIAGFAYRDVGELARAEACSDELLAATGGAAARILKGLCLAGRGRTAEAIAYAQKMKPVEFARHNAHSGGGRSLPSAVANEWIRSQALLTEGDARSALHALGDLDRRFVQRLPFAHDYWQDAALAAELIGAENTGLMYGLAGQAAFLQAIEPSEDTATDPFILGFPARSVPVFVTPDGGYRGGSPFAYVMEQLRRMEEGDAREAETARVRALDLCDGLIARNLRPDLVVAFRARVYLAAGQDDLAREDLAYARHHFAARGEVDPATSLLLGHLELNLRHDEAARELLQEAADAVPDDALAWRGLGVALARSRNFELAGQAMRKALELDPDSVEGWYNLGVMLYRSDRIADALAALEKAWQLDQGDERVVGMLQTVASARRGSDRSVPAP